MTSNAKYDGFIDARVLEAQAEKAENEKKVFLAGPYIDVKKNAAANNGSTAASARFATFKALKKKGNVVILGEHKRLTEVGAIKFEDQNNAVLFERNIIVGKRIDAVIIFPSSPGSFLEFGDWANDPNIGKKMLVLLDKKYEKHENYMNLGTARLAQDVGAQVTHIDYTDHKLILENVEMFMRKISATQNREKIYGRS